MVNKGTVFPLLQSPGTTILAEILPPEEQGQFGKWEFLVSKSLFQERQWRRPLLPPAHPKTCSSSPHGNANSQRPCFARKSQKRGFKGGAGGRELQHRLFPSTASISKHPTRAARGKKKKRGISCADTAPAPAWKNFPLPCSPLALHQPRASWARLLC